MVKNVDVDTLLHFDCSRRISHDEYMFCTNKNQKDQHLLHEIIAIVMWHRPSQTNNLNIIGIN